MARAPVPSSRITQSVPSRRKATVSPPVWTRAPQPASSDAREPRASSTAMARASAGKRARRSLFIARIVELESADSQDEAPFGRVREAVLQSAVSAVSLNYPAISPRLENPHANHFVSLERVRRILAISGR